MSKNAAEDDKVIEYYFDPVEEFYPGDYVGVCTGVEQSLSRIGRPILVFTFRVTEGIYTDRLLSMRVALLKPAEPQLEHIAQVLDLEISTFPLQIDKHFSDEVKLVGKVLRFRPKDAIGKPVILRLTVDTYQDQKSLRISNVARL